MVGGGSGVGVVMMIDDLFCAFTLCLGGRVERRGILVLHMCAGSGCVRVVAGSGGRGLVWYVLEEGIVKCEPVSSRVDNEYRIPVMMCS